MNDGFSCPHCGKRNTATLDAEQNECHDCGKTFPKARKARYTIEIEVATKPGEQVPTSDEFAQTLKQALSAFSAGTREVISVAGIERLTPEALALVEELDALCEKHDVDFNELDELVHDAKNSEGADINSSHEDQLKYLVGGYADLKQAREKLIGIIKSDAQTGMVECHACENNEFAEVAHLGRDKKYYCDECWDPRLN